LPPTPAAPFRIYRKERERNLGDLQELLADVFALYVKPRISLHMTGPNFRITPPLDDHGDQIFEMTDVVAERIRKLGGVALRSIGDIARHQRFAGQRCFLANAGGHADRVLAEPGTDQVPARYHEVCDQHNDVATASLIENGSTNRKPGVFLYETINRA